MVQYVTSYGHVRNCFLFLSSYPVLEDPEQTLEFITLYCRWCLTLWTTSSVKIWKDWRRSVPTEACVTTGGMYWVIKMLFNYTHPKWKLYTVYNGIYYTGDKNTSPILPNSIICRDVKLYQLGSKFIKKIHRILSEIKVINSPNMFNKKRGN